MEEFDTSIKKNGQDGFLVNITPIMYVSTAFMVSTGFFLSLVRMMDPYYRHVIKLRFFELFGEVIDEPKKGIIAAPLNNYLA